jgi:hypothetical protein
MKGSQKKLWSAMLGVAGVAAIGYFAFLRPRHLRWGTEGREADAPLPGDKLIPNAESSATHGITIEASAEDVWPWLAQIGQDKGGFYSYSVLENLLGCQIHNARKVHAEWQRIRAGDAVKFHPKQPAVPVLEVAPNRHLVLGADLFGPNASTWAFVLRDLGNRRCRLITRLRGRGHKGIWRAADLLVVEPAHFVMEQKMMRTIKALAEGEARSAEAAA